MIRKRHRGAEVASISEAIRRARHDATAPRGEWAGLFGRPAPAPLGRDLLAEAPGEPGPI